jgi:hypothetical protein
MAKVVFSFSLDTEKDKNLIRWIEGLPKRRGRSAIIRQALNSYRNPDTTLADILEAIEDLRSSGVAVASQDDDEPQSDVPADVLENLDSLGL